MRKVADWQIAYAEPKFNQQWTYAPLYEGLVMASRDLGDVRYEAVVEKTAKGFDWQLLDDRFPHADDEALGRAYLELYQTHPDPVKIAAVKTILDGWWRGRTIRRSPCGGGAMRCTWPRPC